MEQPEFISVSFATEADVQLIATLRTSVAEQLTGYHGRGHWSSCATEKGVQRILRTSTVIVARLGSNLVGTLRLEAKKPWAIDVSYFTAVRKVVYLHDFAVAPHLQRQGVGRRLIAKAKIVACDLESNAIRLDAYDHPAGAAPFYIKCGFREVVRVIYRGVPLIYLELLL